MKKLKLFILGVLLLVLISVTGTFFINKIKKEKIIKRGNEIFGNNYCGGHPEFQMKIAPALVGFEATWYCEICGRQGTDTGYPTPKLCHYCCSITERCSRCGNLVSSRSKARVKQLNKYNRISRYSGRIAYVPGSNIVILLENYLENYSRIKVVDIKHYKVIKEIQIAKDYYYDYNEEKKFGKNPGRFYFDEGIIVLITPKKEKSFIFNYKEEKFEDYEWQTGSYNNEEYIYMKNNNNLREYYYFNRYDMLVNSLDNLNLLDYYANAYEFEHKSYYNEKIMFQDKEHIIISYSEDYYGEAKLVAYNKSGEKINIRNLLSSDEIVLFNKNLVLKYDLKNDKEIWSYDLNIRNSCVYGEI